MEILYQKYNTLLNHCRLDFKRYLYSDIAWQSRMIGIIGPRGVGKTTLLLQRIKEHLDPQKGLYVSADDLFFSENRLFDVAERLHMYAGNYLFIDEIHKYPNWSLELKNIYDSFPSLQLVFTGSSVLDILRGSSDLSRRAIIYTLHGLSFREYLKLFHKIDEKVYSLPQILHHEVKLEHVEHPMPLFKAYLKRGFYPFGVEEELNLRLEQVILQTLENDIPHYANLSVSTSRKLKQLLSIIAESVPFKPNFTKIAQMLHVSRNSLEDYFAYMEKAGLIAQLRDDTKGIRNLGKVDKVYLDNTNLLYTLVGETVSSGTLREAFFYNQMRVNNQVRASKKVDFTIGEYHFEIGGKNKKQQQLGGKPNSYLVKDEIEYGHTNVIPLWAFGMNY